MSAIVHDMSNRKSLIAWSLSAIVVTLGSLVAVLNPELPLETVATLVFSLVVVSCLLLAPGWRISLLVFYVLAAPPFVDYELAWKAVTAFRAEGAAGLRPDITQPIVCLIDVALLVAFAQSVVTSRGFSRRMRRSDLPVLLFLFLMAGFGIMSYLRVLDSGSTPQRMAALAGSTVYVRIGLGILATLVAAQDKKHMSKLMLGTGLGAWFLLAQSLYISIYKAGSLSSVLVSQLTGVVPGPGAIGSLMLLIGLPLLAQTMLASSRRQKRFQDYFYGLTAGGVFLYALLTYVRSVYVGALTALLSYTLLMFRARRRSVVKLAMLVLMIGGLVLVSAPHFYRMKFTSILSADAAAEVNLGTRLHYWKWALDTVWENPLLGKGASSWGLVHPGSTSTHNFFLQLIAEMGLPFFLSYCLLLTTVMRQGFATARSFRKGNLTVDDLTILSGFMSGIIGVLATQAFTTTLASHRIAIILGVWLGVVLRAGQPKEHIV